MVKSLRLLSIFIIGAALFLFAFYKIEENKTLLISSVENTSWVEQLASKKLNRPVHIGQISANWHGLNFGVELSDLAILNPSLAENLRINKLKISIDLLASLVRWQLVPGDIELDGTHLIIKEKQKGILNINDIPYLEADLYSKNSQKLRYLVDCFLTSGTKKLKNIELSWYDQNNRPVLNIKNLTFNESSRLLTHQFEGSATLWQATPLRFDGKIYGGFLNRHLTYTHVKFNVDQINLKNNTLLLRFMKQLQVTSGAGNIAASLTLKPDHSLTIAGMLNAASVNILTNKLKNYPLQNLSTKFSWRKHSDNQSLNLQQLQLIVDQHLLPIHQLEFGHTIRNNKPVQSIQFDLLPIDELTHFLLENTLVTDKTSTALKALNPTGRIANFSMTFEPGSYQNIAFSGYLNNVGFSAWSRFPAFKNLSGQLVFSPRGGSCKINSKNSVFDFQPMFRAPFLLDSVQAQVSWQKDSAKNLQIKAKNIAIKSKQGEANGYFNILFPSIKSSPLIHSKINFKIVDVSQVTQYSPTTVMSLKVIHWLDNALKSGSIKNGIFILDGRARDFPFDHSVGKFLVTGDLQNGHLNYHIGWPAIEKITANLRFEGRAMTIVSKKANIQGAKVDFVEAKITNLEKAILSIKGRANALSDQLIHFQKDNNPLLKLSQHMPENLTIQGKWQLALNLLIPLDHDIKLPPKYAGRIELENVDSFIVPNEPIMTKLTGALDFTNNSVLTKLMTGEFLAKPFEITLSNKQDATLLKLQYAHQVDGMINFKNNHDGISFERGEIILNGRKAQLPSTPGLKVLGYLPSFDWAKLKANINTKLPSNNNEMFQFNYLSEINVQIGKLHFADNVFSHFHLQSLASRQGMLLKINSDHANGEINLPTSLINPIKVMLNDLIIPEGNKSQSNLSPDDVPPLDLTITNLQYKTKHIRNIDIKLRPAGANLLIKQLSIKDGFLDVSATGAWRKNKAAQETTLNGSLITGNLGAVLNQWQITDNMGQGQGSAKFNLAWPNTPLDPALKNLSGSIDLHFTKGHITKLGNQANFGMDMGKVLTLFSLQTLPRRLMLDFSDLTEPGFSFDDLSGRFQFHNGNVFTENAMIEGPVAKVRINGRIGLKARDYNLKLFINPNVTSSLPVVATLTAGPIVGAATWLVDKVLSHQVKQITEIHYNVTGSWDNPELKNLSENTVNG